MYMSFGSLWEEELFETIPIAIVKEQENKALETMLETLSEEMINLSDEFIYIDMSNKCESLNASVAASILMYEVNNK